MLPALCGDHIFASQPGAFCLQIPTFWTLRRRQQQRCWQLFLPKCIILATFSSQMCPFGDFSVSKCLIMAPFPSNMRHLGDFSTQEASLRRPFRKEIHHFGNFFIHNASFGKLFNKNPLIFNENMHFDMRAQIQTRKRNIQRKSEIHQK